MDYKNLFLIILIGFLAWYFVLRDKEETPAAPDSETSVVDTSAPETPVAETAMPTTSTPAKQVASTDTPVETPRTGPVRSARTPRPTPSPALPLTRFINVSMERLFEPLDEGKVSSTILLEFKKAENTLKDSQTLNTNPTEKEQRLFALSNTICKNLQIAINERNSHWERLEARRGSAAPVSSKNTRVNEAQIKNDLEREKFFTDSIKKSWDSKAKQLKQEIQKNFLALQELEKK